MITAYTATDLLNVHRNTQSHETKNNMTTDSFAEYLQNQIPEEDFYAAAQETEENISDLEPVEYDEMAVIKEKGLVAYIMEQHAKRVREEVMDLLGVSEQELAEMSPEQRSAIEKRIAEETKKRLEAESCMQKNNNKISPNKTVDILSVLNAGIDSRAQEAKNDQFYNAIEKDDKGLNFS